MSTHFARYFGLQLTMKEIHYDGFVAKNMILPCLHEKQRQTFKKKSQENDMKSKTVTIENQNPISVKYTSALCCEILN
jgi:hypothetical protein